MKFGLVPASSLPVETVDAWISAFRCLRRECDPSQLQSLSRAAGSFMAAGNDMSNTLDQLGGSLINAVLGGLILWVGQTTVRHEGVLAGVDEKIAGDQSAVRRRRQAPGKHAQVAGERRQRHEGQQPRAVHAQRRRQARGASSACGAIRRRNWSAGSSNGSAALEIKLAALETQHRGSQEVAALQMQVAQLRGELAMPPRWPRKCSINRPTAWPAGRRCFCRR